MEINELDGPIYLNNLKEMLYGMLKSFVLTDVTLICDDKRQFKAEKIFLNAKSYEINRISDQGEPEENIEIDESGISDTTLNFGTTIIDNNPEKLEPENANEIENLDTNISEPENPCIDEYQSIYFF